LSDDRESWGDISRFDRPDQSPGFRYWRDFMHWQRGLNELLRPLALTQPQFALLATIGWLTERHSEISQSSLAEFLGLEAMHVSQVLSRLEKHGLVSRARSSKDGRAYTVSITTRGKRSLEVALPIVEAYDASFFETPGR
jgi:DNA-binding MarR family transcriptional regulator